VLSLCGPERCTNVIWRVGAWLSICRTIIEAHDGRLWALSVVGYGAIFKVQLPALRPETK
jgi:K+-sensing histidine kinase KdpD